MPAESVFVLRLKTYWPLVASYRNRLPVVAPEVEIASTSLPVVTEPSRCR